MRRFPINTETNILSLNDTGKRKICLFDMGTVFCFYHSALKILNRFESVNKKKKKV